MESFNEIDPYSLQENVFKLLDKKWMLVTGGRFESFNTMTASWGGFGVLWNMNVCFCFIRPTRYTYGFMEKSDAFTLSFFEEKYRDVLEFCGSHSGRDVDKIKETGITPVEGVLETVYFKEASFVFECKKIYFQDINPDHFIDPEIHEHYPERDYHRMYIGEAIRFLKKD